MPFKGILFVTWMMTMMGRGSFFMRLYFNWIYFYSTKKAYRPKMDEELSLFCAIHSVLSCQSPIPPHPTPPISSRPRSQPSHPPIASLPTSVHSSHPIPCSVFLLLSNPFFCSLILKPGCCLPEAGQYPSFICFCNKTL